MSQEESPETYEGPVGYGEAADGRVLITVSVDGAADAVEFDPRVMRLPAEELAEYTRDAMRAAHQDLYDQLVQDDRGAADELQKKVDEMQMAREAQLHV